jgi:hypothetical protein
MFRKSQIRKFADKTFLDLWTFRKCDNLRICDIASHLFFADLKTSANTFTKISLKCSRSNLRTTFVFWDTHMSFRSLKYSYGGKENIRQTNADLDQKHSFFPCKFADLQFADWDTSDPLLENNT